MNAEYLHPDFETADDPLGEISSALAFHPSSFAYEDIVKVVAYDLQSSYGGKWTPENSGSWDGSEPTISALMRLKDGRWAGLIGGADYTGWDCQSDAYYWFADTYEDLLELTDSSLLMDLGLEERPELPDVFRPSDLN